MSFWRFGFSQQSRIDALLSSIPAGADDSGPIAGPSSVTLEQLLEEDDLLQELKAGNAKLSDFLARPHILRRMLAFVDGTAFASDPLSEPPFDEPEEERERKRRKYPYLCAEVLCADVWAIIEPLFRNGGPREYLAPFWDAVLDRPPNELANETSQLAFWAKVNGAWLGTRTTDMITFIKSRPNVVERLLAHIATTSVADLVFRLIQCEDTATGAGIIDWLASEHLIPRLISLLSPSHPPDTHLTVAEFIKAIIAFCSNANANAATVDGQLGSGGPVPQPVGTGGWANAEGQQSDATPNESTEIPPGPRWASNKLLHELAAEDSVATLVGYMLDEYPMPDAPAPSNGSSNSLGMSARLPRQSISLKAKPSLSLSTADGPIDRSTSPGSDGPDTPRASIAALMPAANVPLPPTRPASSNSSLQGASAKLAASADSLPVQYPNAASATSSLINSVSVVIDLIRKNNSDFTEQQILHSLRKEARDLENGSASTSKAAGKKPARGPSLVNLGTLLTVLCARIGDLQRLLKVPRSSTKPVETSIGFVEPLTIERFRLCELYAELLHCSNMQLLNRSPALPPMYDEDGFFIGGAAAVDRLAAALAPTEVEHYAPQLAMSEGRPSTAGALSDATSTYTSPIVPQGHAGPGSDDDPLGPTDEVSLGSPGSSPMQHRSFSRDPQPTSPEDHSPQQAYTGSSTPSTVDSESGVLTRMEAKQLKDLISSSAFEGFDDNADFEEAAAAVGLNGDVSISDDSSIGQRRPVFAPANGHLRTRSAGPRLSPGELLKSKLIEHRVIDTLLELFFRYPWNNFLHGVVYDLIQQTFVARMDRDINRRLCLSVFFDGRLTQRVLDANAANEASQAGPRGGVRLGHMGHLSLVAEEVVKLFQHYPDLIFDAVRPTMRTQEWDDYVSTTLRETRERDLQSLGGGVLAHGTGHESDSSGSSATASPRGLSKDIDSMLIGEDDDEFPMSGSGGRMLNELSDGVPSPSQVRPIASATASGIQSPPPEPSAYGATLGQTSAGAVSTGVLGTSPSTPTSSMSTNQFARYLAQQISGGAPDKSSMSSSDDEDDVDDVAWLGGSGFDPKDVDFELGQEGDNAGFANRWSPSSGKAGFSDDDDDGFGDFVSTTSSPAPAVSSSPPTRRLATSPPSPRKVPAPLPLATSPPHKFGRPRSSPVTSPTRTDTTSAGRPSTPNSRRDPFKLGRKSPSPNSRTSPLPPPMSPNSRRAPPSPLPVAQRLTSADWDAAFVKSDEHDPFADPFSDDAEADGQDDSNAFAGWQIGEEGAGDVDFGEFESAATVASHQRARNS